MFNECIVSVSDPLNSSSNVLSITACDSLDALYLDGVQVASSALPNAQRPFSADIVPLANNVTVIAFQATFRQQRCSEMGVTASDSHRTFLTGKSWKCSTNIANQSQWMMPGFNDSTWLNATISNRQYVIPFVNRGADTIWEASYSQGSIYCRIDISKL